MKALVLALILGLSGANPYPVSQGNKINSGWERVARFSLSTAGYLYLIANSDAIIVSSAGELAPFSRDLKRRPERAAAPGIYFLFLKSSTKWKLMFSPVPHKREPGNKPMEDSECDRWVRKKNLLEEGKAVSAELEKIGVFTTFQAESKFSEKVGVELPWLSWWRDKKLKTIPEFKPVYDPEKAHYIYRLPLLMHNELNKMPGVYCLPFVVDTSGPVLPGVYYFLSWNNVDVKLFNSIGIRLYFYLNMRMKGLSPEEAFLRADTRARLEYSDTQTTFSDLPDIFERIYRRYFQ